MTLNVGDIVDNGFYRIQLIEVPRWNDEKGRWFARGYRWLKSSERWEPKPKLYGWIEHYNKAVL